MPAIVGVTAGDALHERSAEGAPSRPHAALKQDYLDAVVGAGAIPVVIAPDATPAADLVVSRLDGLMLVGGADVDPANYGETPLNDTVSPGPERDALEMALLHSALGRGLPVLAICRGHQVLNVARGGTLWQDLPTQQPDGVPHRQAGEPHTIGHELRVAPGSLLHQIVGSERLGATTRSTIRPCASLGMGCNPRPGASTGWSKPWKTHPTRSCWACSGTRKKCWTTRRIAPSSTHSWRRRLNVPARRLADSRLQ